MRTSEDDGRPQAPRVTHGRVPGTGHGPCSPTWGDGGSVGSADDGVVTVSPLPRHGDVIVGRDVAGRTLRISGHPEAGRVVLSIWQDNVCRATIRLVPEDVPALVEMLTAQRRRDSVPPHERPAARHGGLSRSSPASRATIGSRDLGRLHRSSACSSSGGFAALGDRAGRLRPDVRRHHDPGRPGASPRSSARPTITAVRFDTALRGYRMDQVDAVLDRLQTRIAELECRRPDPTADPWPTSTWSAERRATRDGVGRRDRLRGIRASGCPLTRMRVDPGDAAAGLGLRRDQRARPAVGFCDSMLVTEWAPPAGDLGARPLPGRQDRAAARRLGRGRRRTRRRRHASGLA